MGLFSPDLTELDVLDNELNRIHRELASYGNSSLTYDSHKECYLALVAALKPLHEQLIKLTNEVKR